MFTARIKDIQIYRNRTKLVFLVLNIVFHISSVIKQASGFSDYVFCFPVKLNCFGRCSNQDLSNAFDSATLSCKLIDL